MATMTRSPLARSWQNTTCSYPSASMRSNTFTRAERTGEPAPGTGSSLDLQDRRLVRRMELAEDLERASAGGPELHPQGLVRVHRLPDAVALDREAVRLVGAVADVDDHRVLLGHGDGLRHVAGAVAHEGGGDRPMVGTRPAGHERQAEDHGGRDHASLPEEVQIGAHRRRTVQGSRRAASAG